MLPEYGRYWVRLRTHTALRWVAIAGQTVALFLAASQFGVRIDLAACLAVVAAAAAVNFLFIFAFPGSARLSVGQTAAGLVFDTCQLALLLYLTGGLNNPFALLLIVPATIAAATLPSMVAAAVGAVTIVSVSVIAWTSTPLLLESGDMVVTPPLFSFGFWISIVIGIIFLGLYSRRVAAEVKSMSDALLATQIALAREQKLSDLGGVVAAAAHELGTPLATITLVSSELDGMVADQPELLEDVRLIRAQADRCRDILRSMGQSGKSDLLVKGAPVSEVIREAAEPHQGRGKAIRISVRGTAGGGDAQPEILRYPELVHGLRNLVQNAVDFAADTVWIDCSWTEGDLTIRISDNGPGYPANLIGRIGDPFLRGRRGDDAPARPGYDGMGLGLFISKTLLERTGATVRFTNGADPFLTEDERPEKSGAVVAVLWPRDRIERPGGQAFGDNPVLVN
ncbi:MAG: ActS/PrrB/RegB family redox-sensitive histidine kinase [Rhodobacteraceae bacterium]|nr:ActS/PrrB/RegB family redox-sensitive histidine kinase [Paracoccaceae bacterium]